MERRAFMGATLAAVSTSAIAANLSPTIDFSGIHWAASNQNNRTEDGFLNIGSLAITGNTTVTDIYVNLVSSGNSPSFQASGYVLTSKDRPTNSNYLPVNGSMLAITTGDQVATGNALVLSYKLLLKYGLMELYCDINARTLSGTCVAYWINALHERAEAFNTTLTFAPSS